MSPEPPLDATGIARRPFSTVRRGYEPAEVRAFLHDVADMIGRLQRSEAHERARADRAETRAVLAEQLDQHRLVELLGEETARVLDSARAAAADMRARAQDTAARIVRDAEEEARGVIEQAEGEAATRRLEILAEADGLRREAEAEVERSRDDGRAVVEEMRREAEEAHERMLAEGERARAEAESEAEAIRASAREEGNALVAEAHAVREHVLGDLARRRRSAREQLERLSAARDRLIAAYEVVRRTVDEAMTELDVVLPEAKAAGDLAMRRVHEQPDPTAEELEAELAVARMAGLVGRGTPGGADAPSGDGEPDAAQQHAMPLLGGAHRDQAGEAREAGGPDEEEAGGRSGESGGLRSLWPFRRSAGGDGGAQEPVGEPGEDAPPGESEGIGEAADVGAAGRAAAGVAPSGPEHPADERAEGQPVAGGPGGGPTAAVGETAEGQPAVGETDEGQLAVGERAGRQPVAGGPGEGPTAAVGGTAESQPAVGETAEGELAVGAAAEGRPVMGEPGVAGVEESGRATAIAQSAASPVERGAPGDEGRESGGVETTVDRPDGPRVDAAHGDDVPEAGDHEEGGGRVDRLFARIKAERGASAAEAGGAPAGDVGAVPSARGARSEPSTGGTGSESPSGDAQPEAPAAAGHTTRDDMATALLLARDVALADSERELSRRLKRVLADEQNEVFDILRRRDRRREKPSCAADVLPPPEDHVERYASAGHDDLAAAAHLGAESVGGRARAPTSKLASAMGEAVARPIRERIDHAFEECGGDLDEVTERLRSLYREWKGQRISAVARHYTAAAFARGAYDAVPSGADVVWLVDRTAEPCPDADDNALAGRVRKGQRFPTGHRCPPAHPDCRCLVVPAE